MLITAIKMVRQSIMVSFPISIHIEIMIAIDATFTASKKTAKTVEFRIFLTNGFNNATKMNEGKKMAIVEINAPEKPLI